MMSLAGMPVVWHSDCLLHEPDGEVWLGVWEAGTEVPERATVLLEAVTSAGAEVVPAQTHDDAAILAVHDEALVAHLSRVWEEWEAAGYVSEHGRRRVVPYVFPTAGLLSGLPLRSPRALHGRVGRFCYDTMTLIGPGTWRAARAAADAALTAADLVAGGGARRLRAVPPARPPRRADRLRRLVLPQQRGDRRAGAAPSGCRARGRHRSGRPPRQTAPRRSSTTASDVYVGSLHVDPGTGWFPHYVGYAGERGTGEGLDANRNLPLAPGTDDATWLEAVDVLCADVAAHGAEALVVSLGLDAAASDPESPLDVSADGYRQATARIAPLAPAVVVQEGGYDLSAIGHLVVAALDGFVPRRLGLARGLEQQPGGLDVRDYRGRRLSREQPQHSIHDGGDRAVEHRGGAGRRDGRAPARA